MTSIDAAIQQTEQTRRAGVVGWVTQNWNVQTVLAVGAVAFAAASTFFTTGNEIDKLKAFQLEHTTYHKDRAAELANLEGRNEQRFAAIDKELRKVDELTFRAARADESISSTKEAITKLEATVNGVVTDMRVIREILERMDGRRITTPRPNSH